MPNTTLQADFKGTDETLLKQLQGALFERLMESLRKQIDVEDINLQSYIVSQKLSGQVLHHRSGQLIDSIRVIPAVVNGAGVTGGVEGAGGVAFYGRYFEEGGKGPYEIRPKTAKALAWEGPGGEMIFAKKVMHPAIPKLPFMKPSLDENREKIIGNIRTTCQEVLQSIIVKES